MVEGRAYKFKDVPQYYAADNPESAEFRRGGSTFLFELPTTELGDEERCPGQTYSPHHNYIIDRLYNYC